ncbi:energy transducer TonB [Flavobacteriaceae bacterium F89]|uniref:Energy transducer TonB n=1 Tax=Cerina litoralis TaxID=2874477 RepID=A0AAE3EXA0_9FLAO|nr:energy transducer TonB [Cerina litoralis]MCG2461437.1 energy transducer TonB [Cerina litoralis]
MKKQVEKAVDSHGNGNNGQLTKPVCRVKGKQGVNLQNKGTIYFQIGLFLALLLTYLLLQAAFQIKVMESPNIASSVESPIEYFPDLDRLVVEKKKVKDQPVEPVVDPQTFNVVDDDAQLLIAKEYVADPDPSEGDLNLDSLAPQNIDDDYKDAIPFSVIEEVPVFPGCENAKDKRTCFSEMMQKHIRKNFRYPEIAQEMGVQGMVMILFTIQKDGSIGNIRMRGPDKNLEAEARRIIEKLPKMSPGKQRGRPVSVPFSIPIRFNLQ